MKLKLNLAFIVMLVTLTFLSGCATTRGEVELAIPVAADAELANGKEIYINSIVDKRSFEIKPKEPNIPSLDPGEPQSDSIKLRAIARKRNSYGKGLGDILLKEGQTVETIIHDSLKQAFIQNGYSVLENEEQITKNTYIVDSKINKFWSWMNPGFWAITLSTEISTDINIQKESEEKNEVINVKVFDKFQTGSGSNWVSVMQDALKAYIKEVKSKLK